MSVMASDKLPVGSGKVEADGQLPKEVSVNSDEEVASTTPFEAPLAPLSPTMRFFRGTLFQILVVGLCAFTAPGIWVAMNSLGVGGTESPNLVNGANAALYAFMTFTCLAGPWLTNLVGFRWTLAIGTLGYPLYAAGLYVNLRYGPVWFVYVGAIACGISAGFFWSVEGAISTGYPERHKRGRYLATWFTFRNAGSFVGGSVALSLNVNKTSKGSVSYATYLGFIVIQCLGFPAGLMLSNPEKVRRDDGTRIYAFKVNVQEQFQHMKRLLKSKPILLLVPCFWYFGWIQAYPGTYLETYFSVRSRALGGFMFAVMSTIGTWLGGTLVDLPWAKKRQTRIKIVFAFIAVINSMTWIWAVIIQHQYSQTKPTLDWSDQKTFGPGFGLYMFEWLSLAMVENYIYYCMGNLSDSPGDMIRFSSLLRAVETASVAISFGVQAAPAPLIVTAGLNFALWFIALPAGWYATMQVVKRMNEIEAMEPRVVEK